ncbi:protein DDB_G0287365-like [Gigantopelta aegis]|uniref:protein DDB_G0287365-like n=1 Tax=Gigantopelta aegis TaxID=1735272 RepID=UPI001B889937|nr:protein DDB_G0287365-like [Gigantopelta aegis]
MTGARIVLCLLAFATERVTATITICPNAEVGLQPWDDSKTWGGPVPQEGDQVVISSGMKVLLNVSPSPLDSITIEEGGFLIWGDFDDLTLTVSYILVKGNFEIGGESLECRFTKKANIVLTGLSNSTLEVEGYGRKFIGVAENGTVEFHGGNKLSWTRLVQTVPAAKTTCGVLYNHQTEAFSTEYVKGLHVLVFNLDGSVFDFQVFYTASSKPSDAYNNFKSFLTGIPVNKTVAVFVHRNLGKESYPGRDWEKVFTAVEAVGGLKTGSSLLRQVLKDEAYAFITRTGDSSLTKEDIDTKQTDELFLDVPETSLRFVIQDGFSTDILVLTKEVVNPKIKLMDDVSSWKDGDEIVVTSTDFEWRQTEVFKLVSCKECANNEKRLDHPFKYMHYGEVTHGVDERAEVALLTRDIVIEGVLEDTCYSNNQKEAQLCDFFDSDTFGGHFKMMRGFKAAHIEQVEFYHMGQQAFLGSYPIHFHMCDDVDGAWVRSNSIHHSQARCVTIHGTDGLEVSDNVCYKHKGHGFFLEDSAEQRNILDGNLGIGTEHGTHIPSDMSKDMCSDVAKPFCDSIATFWITHPNNYIRNNVAAGSDKNGFQFSVAKEPLGPSKQRQLERGLVTKDSAMYTKITEFKNNVAHSNVNNQAGYSFT